MEQASVDKPGSTSSLENDSLALLRKLIRSEESLLCPKDNNFLLKFLRARKYNADAALKTIQKYFRAKRDYPRIFDNFSPSGMLYDVVCREHKLLAVSSERDAHGRAVMLVRTDWRDVFLLDILPKQLQEVTSLLVHATTHFTIGVFRAVTKLCRTVKRAWNTSICTLDEFTKAVFVLVEWMLLHEDVQKRGVVFVIDYKGLGLHHLMQFPPFAIQRLVRLTQDCYPVAVKAVYVNNSPAIFHVFFSVAKTFMKNKLVQRVHVVGSEKAKLHDVVPSDLIPNESGGTFESYDYDKLERDLLSRSYYFQEVSRCGYDKGSTQR